jgi:hypothetical protein
MEILARFMNKLHGNSLVLEDIPLIFMPKENQTKL